MVLLAVIKNVIKTYVEQPHSYNAKSRCDLIFRVGLRKNHILQGPRWLLAYIILHGLIMGGNLFMNNWFLKDEHTKFRSSIAQIINDVALDLCRSGVRDDLGDEHEQCVHLFTKIYTLMEERQRELTANLLCCSRINNPVVELRYYRSKRYRKKSYDRPQFVEKETGADFALALRVDLPGTLQAERSVLGQAKISESPSVDFNLDQLDVLLQTGGSESAAYLIWSENFSPMVVSAENVAVHVRSQKGRRLKPNITTLGRSLSDFFCDAFIGLWFGKAYDPVREGDNPPLNSIPILFHFLHRGAPPPNVVYFGISDADVTGVRPGVYVTEIRDI